MPQNSELYITGEDYAGNDVASAPDDLTGTSAQNKAIFDRLVKTVVAPKHNQTVDELLQLSQSTYTKSETTTLIDEKMIAIGAGDMRAAQYDPSGEIAAGGGIEAALAINGVQAFAHTYADSVHALQGSELATNIKFTATAPYSEGDTFTVNGTPCTAQSADGEALQGGCFVAGAVVQCFLNGTQLNFKAGGAGLNFKILAVAHEDDLPQTAAENTIAVITDTPIAQWAFASANPFESPSEGSVFIETSVSSTNAFNALRKNSLMVYPISGMQYIAGSWLRKTTYFYQNGLWVDGTTYLYKDGKEFPAITGGWSGGWAKNASSLSLYGGSGVGVIQTERTTAKVSVTDEAKLKFSGTVNNLGSSATLRFGLSTTTELGGLVAYGTTLPCEIDVSALSGEYYVIMYYYGYGPDIVVTEVSLQ